MTKISRITLSGAAIGLACVLSASAAMAQTQPAGGMANFAPRRPANQAMTHAGQFILNGYDDVELVRFSTPHDLAVCLPAKMDVHGRPDLDASRQYPIIVNWDDETAELWPGNCLAFDAATVTVSPSSTMPQADHVEGDVYVL